MSERNGEMGKYLILDDLIDGLNGRDLSEYMNQPEPSDGKAYVQFDYKTGKKWVHCPFCGKRIFPLSDNAIIKNLVWKCKSSSCKREFVINIE